MFNPATPTLAGLAGPGRPASQAEQPFKWGQAAQNSSLAPQTQQPVTQNQLAPATPVNSPMSRVGPNAGAINPSVGAFPSAPMGPQAPGGTYQQDSLFSLTREPPPLPQQSQAPMPVAQTSTRSQPPPMQMSQAPQVQAQSPSFMASTPTLRGSGIPGNPGNLLGQQSQLQQQLQQQAMQQAQQGQAVQGLHPQTPPPTIYGNAGMVDQTGALQNQQQQDYFRQQQLVEGLQRRDRPSYYLPSLSESA